MAWETAFLELAGGELRDLLADQGLRLSFSAERSVQDELARESGAGGGSTQLPRAPVSTAALHPPALLEQPPSLRASRPRADLPTVALSYVVMLAYIAFALGSFPRHATWRQVVQHSRAALGLGGVLIVAAAVLGALGVCAAAGLPASLISLEAIPFVALAGSHGSMLSI